MILVHYGEIGLKGKNRNIFENFLTNNIKKALGDSLISIQKERGRILLSTDKNIKDSFYEDTLSRLPGIENFSFVKISDLDLDSLKQVAASSLKNYDFQTFKISTKRGNKNFPYTSIEVNKHIGTEIQKIYGKKVNLTVPDVTLFIEIGKSAIYLYQQKSPSIGGLPTGSEGSVLSLISGGIDSPVASWMMMKRGCKLIFCHFFNKNLSPSAEKVKKIIQQLTKTQLSSKAYFVPFEHIQHKIIKTVPSKYRMIVYRRFMIRLSEKIALKEKVKGLVTGDSLGQVASQTLENIQVIQSGSCLPFFMPLIGLNKNEIISVAKNIGTYNFSIEAYDDCCSYMIAKHPVIKSNIKDINKLEQNISVDIDDVISKAEITIYSN